MKKKSRSIRIRLFSLLALSVILMVILLVLINTVVYKPFYKYSKERKLLEIYELVSTYYLDDIDNIEIQLELEKLASENSVDIAIRNDENRSIFATNKDFIGNLVIAESQEEGIFQIFNNKDVLYKEKRVAIQTQIDNRTGVSYLILKADLEDGSYLYIRLATTLLIENVKISNTFLAIVGSFIIVLSGLILVVVSKKFTSPILELENIAKKIANLDFSEKYEPKDVDDEINNLGKSINQLSEQLEKTINELQKHNTELEKDIEKKSKIDEMRKQFISDVSHELKTPISLIQGYAEGLKENVSADEESRNFYINVILDETNKMDTLVKKLLELMKLEAQAIKVNNNEFNINELVSEVIKKSKMILEEKKIKLIFENKDQFNVWADSFYIEKVINNYFTNAIKNVLEVNGEKYIEIKTQDLGRKIKISIFNTGSPIEEKDITKIWDRFYKADKSRNRDDGSTGIGLAFVKAIMNNYKEQYGVINKENGVEFYFELDKQSFTK